MDEEFVKKGIVWFFIFSIILLSFFIVRPLIVPIIFGILFGYLFLPLYRYLNKYIRNKDLCIFILIILLTILIMGPLIYFAPNIFRQSLSVYMRISNFDFYPIFEKLSSDKHTVEILSSNSNTALRTFVDSLAGETKKLLVNILEIGLKFFVFLIVFYFVLRDSDKIRDYFSRLSPFSKSNEEKFVKELKSITNSIVYGQIFIGVVQGFVLWIGLFFLGVKDSLFLAFIGTIFAIIPIIGPWLIWIPVSLALIASGSTYKGIFLFFYGVFVVSTIDNIIRPYLVSKYSTLSIPLSIIGIIGGLMVFGIVGLIIGPLVLSYLVIIIDFYREGRLKDLFNEK